MAAEFRYNYLNYIIMFICIDKTETIHHFKLLFCRKSAEFPENSVKLIITLSPTSLSWLNASHGSHD